MKWIQVMFLGLSLPLILAKNLHAEAPVDQSILHEANVGLGSSVGRQLAPGQRSFGGLGSVQDACAQFRAAGIPGVADTTGLAKTGGTGAGTAATPTPAAGPINPNPSIADITAFVTQSCTGCHGTTVTGTDAKTARIVKGTKSLTFAQALEAVNTNPSMTKVKAQRDSRPNPYGVASAPIVCARTFG